MPAVLGGYALLERIAVGGMAEVFLATKDGRRVALKRILPHLRVPDFVTMFAEEARLLLGVSHAHVVRAHDFGVDGDVHYLAMEHVAGLTLRALIVRAAELRRPLPAQDAVALLLGACEGLHHVHQQGILHRDVTPSNLLVSWDGVVKLADFGIATVDGEADALKGKLAYMSPEQARGERLDPRSDVFSLGVCAWELLTLRRLRPRPSLKLAQSGVVPRTALPHGLEPIVYQALAKAPEDRHASARAFGEALADWLGTAGPRPAERLREYFGEPPPSLSIEVTETRKTA
jgi:serine/threonine-protein kinase